MKNKNNTLSILYLYASQGNVKDDQRYYNYFYSNNKSFSMLVFLENTLIITWFKQHHTLPSTIAINVSFICAKPSSPRLEDVSRMKIL